MGEKDEGMINIVWWIWQTFMKAPDRKVLVEMLILENN
jgi:hypothetical protein